MIDKIRDLVTDICMSKGSTEEIWWLDHIKHVENQCMIWAQKEGADKEVLSLAAWLHDISKIKGSSENHHITGAEEAAQILQDLSYQEEIIQQVQHCILAHSSDPQFPPTSKEAKIFADIDGIAHFDDFPAFAHYAYAIRKDGIRAGSERLLKRYERVWNKLSPRAKSIAREKYEAIQLVLRCPI